MSAPEPPRKKLKVDDDGEAEADAETIREKRSTFLSSLSRSITPPQKKPTTASMALNATPSADPAVSTSTAQQRSSTLRVTPSPFQLTRIRDLSSSHNVDTVALQDLLGDPMIKECWQFNYLFDVDWLVGQFDEDVRGLVQIKIVHGSWKREAPNRIGIEDGCRRHKNVRQITAYLPDPFGTHHSKMMILFRHDDHAQIIIHTANMIPQDWTNMCQAIWRSPLLPLKVIEQKTDISNVEASIGYGPRFKQDLLAYLHSYQDQYGKSKLKGLAEQLELFDFSQLRAALVASVPSKVNLKNTGPDVPLWGWPSLKRILRHIPSVPESSNGKIATNGTQDSSTNTPHIVLQVSSIATLGQNDNYLKNTLFSALSSTIPESPIKADTSIKPGTKARIRDPKFSIIFPIAQAIRNSLDGYASGGSIHMKIQSPAQQKQLQYLRPYLCHWAPPSPMDEATYPDARKALRQTAAPHIKTYIRFSNSEKLDQIDWAMLNSANLSTQAWGSASNQGEVRVQSYEIGVIVWPDLYREEGDGDVRMSPVFGQDSPNDRTGGDGRGGRRLDEPSQEKLDFSKQGQGVEAQTARIVGLRMPYDLPLAKYSRDDVPWCATMNYTEPDRWGRGYGGFEER